MSRVQPVGQTSDSTLKLIQRSRARIEEIQADLTREQSLLQQALGSVERLRDEAATSVLEPTRRPGADGRRGLRGRGSEVESSGCTVAARARSQAGGGRELGQEGSDSVDARWIWPRFILELVDRAVFKR